MPDNLKDMALRIRHGAFRMRSAALAALLCAGVAGAEPVPDIVVNVNTATVEQLAFLPGIGPVTADNILYARELGKVFASASDLQVVKGIGPKKSEKVAPYLVFGDEPTTATSKIGSTAKVSSAATKISRPEAE